MKAKRLWRSSLLGLAWIMNLASLSWADVKPGDTISRENISQAEGLLTPATRWMVERGMRMDIVAPKKVDWPAAYREVSEKFAKQVQLSADGKELSNYVAGWPFPHIDPNDPLAGHKIMWNYEHAPYDSMGSEFVSELVDSQGGIRRTFVDRWRRLKWSGRLSVEPKPEIPHTPPIRRTDLFGPSFMNNEGKGSVLLSIRYQAATQPDELYVFIGKTRRIERISAARRGESLGAGSPDPDSWAGFNGKPSMWTFRVLAQKEILAVVHSGRYGDRSAWCAPRDGTHGFVAAFPCVSWEKRRVWVVEGVPTGYSQYAYAKRIFYIDQDFFGLVLTELYDPQGEFWRFFLPCYFFATQPYTGYPTHPIEGGSYDTREERPFIPNALWVDVQEVFAFAQDFPSGYATPAEWITEWYFNAGGPLNSSETHSLGALRQMR